MSRMWTLRSLASATVLAVLAGGAAAQTAAGADRPAAVVNGEPITLAEVDAVIKSRPLPTEPTEVQRREMQMAVLEELVVERLMRQYMSKYGPQVDAATVDKRIAELADSLKSQGKTLPDFYRENSLTEAQLRQNFTFWLQKVTYVSQRLTEDYLKRYYGENRDFFDKVRVQVSHIVLRVAPSAADGDRQAARAKLQALRAEIVAGRISFADAAKKYSQCSSAPQGGDLGYIARKWQVDESFARAAFALKVGDISDVVQSDYGLHLIKVTDRKQDGPPSQYDQVKDLVREMAGEDLLMAVLAKVRHSAQIQVNLEAEPTAKIGQ